MATSTESRELDLVGKVEMRIALAKDDKLESILKPYLAPLLLKLASEHVSVRNMVSQDNLDGGRDLTYCRLSQHVSISKSGLLGISMLSIAEICGF